MPFDPIVKRTEGTVRDNATGAVYKTSKGAPHVMLNLIADSIPASNDGDRATAMKKFEVLKMNVEGAIESFGLRGIRTLAVAKSADIRVSSTGELSASSLQWEFLGLLTFLDPPRPDTKQVRVATFPYLSRHNPLFVTITSQICMASHLIIATLRSFGCTPSCQIVLQCVILCRTTSRCVTLRCGALYCVVLCCTALRLTALRCLLHCVRYVA
jgi:hypothetical protein